jgi:hypothetical protein
LGSTNPITRSAASSSRVDEHRDLLGSSAPAEQERPGDGFLAEIAQLVDEVGFGVCEMLVRDRVGRKPAKPLVDNILTEPRPFRDDKTHR